jgi:hypothetical protein
MAREHQAGDDLLFQLESGFGLLRVLAVEEDASGEVVWQISAYEDLFLDGDAAEMFLNNSQNKPLAINHAAITNRAFERTPTAKLGNRSLTENEMKLVENWKSDVNRKVEDRSALQLLGLR